MNLLCSSSNGIDITETTTPRHNFQEIDKYRMEFISKQSIDQANFFIVVNAR